MDFELWQVAVILLGGFAGGGLNALAGGGTFLSFPTLLMVGIAPVSANATNAVALWPASLSTAWALRRELRVLPLHHYLLPLALAAMIGGLGGGVLLLLTSDQLFYELIPWLLLLATLLFSFSKPLARLVAHQRDLAEKPRLGLLGFFCQLLVSLYGGFFGAGMGIMMIASLAISGRTRVVEISAIKSLLSSVIYSVATLTFVIAGAVHWPALLIMLVGTITGGYCGGILARWLPDPWLRALVILIGWGLSVFYFYEVYG